MGLFGRKDVPLPKELLDWIGTAVREGYTLEEIRSHLEKAGYTDEDIRRALDAPVATETLPAELMAWLTDALKEGYAPEEIRAHLEKAGYSKEQVRHALGHAQIRRASAVWAGQDSVQRHSFPVWIVPLVAVVVLALAGGIALFDAVPEKALLTPSAMAPGGGSGMESLFLSSARNVSLILGFKPGLPHSIAIRASSPGNARLVLSINGDEVASAAVSGKEASFYLLAFVPSQESGTATLLAEGEVALFSVVYRRPRDVRGSLGFG